jgi:nitroreductase
VNVLEAMETTRAIRYLKPDPVPRELIEKVIYAATRASSPGNSQAWDFVVVTERATKAKLGPVLRERMLPMVQAMPATPGVVGRMLGGAQHLLKHFEDVPAWIFVCGRKVYPPGAGTEQMLHAALYPAAQNLIVAARSLGLGTTFTTFQLAAEPEMRAALNLPSDVSIGVCIALGYPDRAFGAVARKPVAEVLHWERW